MTQQREIRAFEARPRLITTTILFATLAASPDTNGTDVDVELGELQDGEVLLDYDIEVVEAVSGGSVASLAMIVGDDTDDDNSIVAAFDALSVAGLYKGTAGVRPRGMYGGKTLVANFDPDGGHKVSDLTAGQIKIHLHVSKPDARTID